MLQRLLTYLLTASFFFSSSLAYSNPPPSNETCPICQTCSECVCNCPDPCTASGILQTAAVAFTPLIITFIGLITTATTAVVYHQKHQTITKALADHHALAY